MLAREPGPLDLEELLQEVERYLAAVDVFRVEGHEPRWRRMVEDYRACEAACYAVTRTEVTEVR